MRISFTVRRESECGDTVRYVDASGAANPFFAGAIVLKASALPVPVPETMEVALDWREPAKVARTAADTGKPALGGWGDTILQELKPGVRVRIVKSRVSGVHSPPEWLQQYVGKVGVVLWPSADGAMLEVDGAPAWFSHYELELLG